MKLRLLTIYFYTFAAPREKSDTDTSVGVLPIDYRLRVTTNRGDDFPSARAPLRENVSVYVEFHCTSFFFYLFLILSLNEAKELFAAKRGRIRK